MRNYRREQYHRTNRHSTLLQLLCHTKIYKQRDYQHNARVVIPKKILDTTQVEEIGQFLSGIEKIAMEIMEISETFLRDIILIYLQKHQIVHNLECSVRNYRPEQYHRRNLRSNLLLPLCHTIIDKKLP